VQIRCCRDCALHEGLMLSAVCTLVYVRDSFHTFLTHARVPIALPLPACSVRHDLRDASLG
jgi:hypothetical protein